MAMVFTQQPNSRKRPISTLKPTLAAALLLLFSATVKQLVTDVQTLIGSVSLADAPNARQ